MEELEADIFKQVHVVDLVNTTEPFTNMSFDPCAHVDSRYFYEDLQRGFLWILFLVIVSGNSIVLAAVGLLRGSRRSRMTFFIIQLAIADILVGFIGVLKDVISKTTVTWEGGPFLCKLVNYSEDVVYYASTFVLVSLSIDRLDAIARPMSFSGSGLRAKILIVIAWVTSFVFSIPRLFLTKYSEKDRSCSMMMDLWQWQLYFTLVTVAIFILPAILICGCYTVIICIVWNKSKLIQPIKRRSSRGSRRSNGCTLNETNSRDNLRGNSRASSRGVIPQAKIKTIKMTLVIVLVFIFCWSPFFIFNLLQVYDHIPCSNEMAALGTFITSLAPLNSAANPIIYGIFSTRICRYLRKVPVFDWIAVHICLCCKDRRFRKSPPSGAGLTEYSTMTDAEHVRVSSLHYRRPSGLPFVRNNLSEKENEILLRTLKTNTSGHCDP